MATLPSGDIDVLWQQLMEEYSSIRAIVPINKNQFRQLLVLIDSELETAETSIVAALPSGPGRTWLIGNQSIGRHFIERTEKKRKEVL